MSFINTPLGYVLSWLSSLFSGNFAAAVFVFTLLINLVMLPLTIKSQKSSAAQARLKPRLEAIKKKCGDDKLKFNQEQRALMEKENVSMAGGCLPMIIRLVIMWGVYAVITSPMTYILNLDSTLLNDAANSAKDLGLLTNVTASSELNIFGLIKNGAIEVAGISPDALNTINFNFFGINLTEIPNFDFNIFNNFQAIWWIPIISFVTAILNSLATMAIQKKMNPDAPNMAGMMLTMPILSLVIAFTVPGAVGLYWAASNIISGGLQIVIQIVYNPNRMIAMEQAKNIIKKNKAETAVTTK